MSSDRFRNAFFVTNQGGNVTVMSHTEFKKLVKEIGAVAFIRLLLIMAGVEPNPGPTDKLLFRYEYLLIEVGTEVLRNVFDQRVGNDFMRYLNANRAEYKQLFYLTNNILNDTQKDLLPPIDMKPSATNFDITLLALLLRNVCGLTHRGDPVWKNPAPGDSSVEADITRLRNSRNDLQHFGTVYTTEADYTDKWDNLCEILKRLGSYCGMTNLPKLIDGAQRIEIDEELKKRLDNTVKAWGESERLFDRGIEELKLGQSKLACGQSDIKRDISDIKDGQSKMEVGQSTLEGGQTKLADGQSELKRNIWSVEKQVGNIEQTLRERKRSKLDTEIDIKEILRKHYLKNNHTLGLSPLCGEDDCMELVTIYQPPEMCHVPYHRSRQQEGNYPISSFKDIFSRNDNIFRNVFITGDTGVGKTSFCQCMSYVWCKSLSSETVSNKYLKECAKYMAKFDYVFYISLRDTIHEDIIDMIIDQFFYTKSGEKREEMIQTIENILQQKNCLIILDALDEWSPNTSGGTKCVLPRKIPSDKCIYLTTCRPYIIEKARLSNNDIEHQVEMKGITKHSSMCYIEKIVNHFKHVYQVDKDPKDFVKEVKSCGLEDQLCIPIIASQLVLVWFKQALTNMSRALIYSNVVEMLFERADLKRDIELPSTTECKVQLPESFEKLPYLHKYAPLLQKVCLLSFRSLFKLDNHVSVLVFPRKKLMSKPYFLSSDELDFLCKLGILSKNKVIGPPGELEQKLSFLHKSYLEFLSALFVSCFDTNGLFDHIVKAWSSKDDVVPYGNFFLLLAGLSVQKVQWLFDTTLSRLMILDRKVVRELLTFDSILRSISTNHQSYVIQDIVISCIKEARRSTDTNNALHFSDFFIYGYLCLMPSHQLPFPISCVTTICSTDSKYWDVFDEIQGLKQLHVEFWDTGPKCTGYDVKFNACMSKHQCTLKWVGIENFVSEPRIVPQFSVSSLHHLTTLYLSGVTIEHNCLDNLVSFLSGNAIIECIDLAFVGCNTHQVGSSTCSYTLNIENNTKLTTLCIRDVYSLHVCNNVNISNLKYISLGPIMANMDVFDYMKYSKLEYLNIFGNNQLYDTTVKTLTTSPCMKSLRLVELTIPDGVLLQLHPDVKHVNIELFDVTMSRSCFHCFITSCVNRKSVIKVELTFCYITLVNETTHSRLSISESRDYMSTYLTSNYPHSVNITSKYGGLNFETTVSK